LVVALNDHQNLEVLVFRRKFDMDTLPHETLAFLI
jgi:hypothetical protein